MISAQVARACPEADSRVELFQMSRMVEDGAGMLRFFIKRFNSELVFLSR